MLFALKLPVNMLPGMDNCIYFNGQIYLANIEMIVVLPTFCGIGWSYCYSGLVLLYELSLAKRAEAYSSCLRVLQWVKDRGCNLDTSIK